MKTTRQIALATVGIALAFVFGCSTDSKKEVYYMIAANVQLPYWKTAANGFKKAASQYQVTANVAGPNTYDPLGELDALQQAVRAHPAGILISVADAGILQREVDIAVQSGIPLITMDSDAAATRRLYFIGTNNVEAGRLGGSRLIDKLGTKGNVAVFTIPGQPNLEDRLRGLKEGMSFQPGIKVTDIIDIKGDAATAFDKAQQLIALTGAKKIDAFVCLEAISGKPVADAIKRASAHDREVLSWDADPGTLDAIKDGTIDATIAQKPYTMGYFGLRMLYNVSHNAPDQLNKDFRTDFYSPFPVFIDTGTTLVDRGNVDLYLSATAAASEK